MRHGIVTYVEHFPIQSQCRSVPAYKQEAFFHSDFVDHWHTCAEFRPFVWVNAFYAFLHEMREANALLGGRVCPAVRIIHLLNYSSDFY